MNRSEETVSPNQWLNWRKEAEEFQPLSFDREIDLEQFFKAVFAFLVLEGKELPPPAKDLLPLAFKSPYLTSPILKTLAHLIKKELSLFHPPLVPIHPFMSFAKSCELALLWAVAGEKSSAIRLREKLLPLIELPTLWTKENEYRKKEAKIVSALLASRGLDELGEIDPYFLALSKRLPPFPEAPIAHKLEDPLMGLLLERTEKWTVGLTLAGDGTTLGALKAKEVEIVALGPQLAPLRDPEQFGIFRHPDSQPIETWTCLASKKEVWLEVKPRLEREFLKLSLRFLGLAKEPLEAAKPVYFSFYISAKEGQIEDKTYLPCTLERYSGEAKKVSFQKSLWIASDLPGKMELIPLVGDGAFWDAGFLLAFEIAPFEAKGEFSIWV